MPKRTDIQTILILGAGPIVIGQGCEFDYSGTQACKALKAEGYRVVLINSNPATIMTDPELAERTYIEPITPEGVRKILRKQLEIGDPVHAVLPTLGGQTALNCACRCWDEGIFQEFNVQMIGADRKVIHRAEDRQVFKDICESLGLKLPKARTVNTIEDAEDFLKQIGLPAVIRPAFTLGGSGGGIAYNREEFTEIVTRGLRASMIGQVQIDQSVIGWKEYELEVVRDKHDNCVIVCGIENIDPMGIHTGDSITVAPIQTLSDKEYQAMRDAALAIMRAVGVETGGSNVQFAVNPNPKARADGTKPFEMVVVEMNPRVSRSSALASKATGFPIAKIAAKLAIGYTLDELKNEITGTTSACFEPSIDYVVTKIPRFTFEKFPEADETLTTQMKSVGEAMAIGRTFCESFQKALRSMEIKRFGLGLDRNDHWLLARLAERGAGGRTSAGTASGAPSPARTADGELVQWPIPEDKLTRKLAVPSQGRLFYIRYAMKMGWSDARIFGHTNIDPWFLSQIRRIVAFEDVLLGFTSLTDVPASVMRDAKQLGFSDAQLANIYLGSISPVTILTVRARRKALGIEPVYKLVDTCAAEFEAVTPYFYSTYETPYRVVKSGEVAGWQGGKANATTDATSAAGSVSSPCSATGPRCKPATSCIVDDEVRISATPKVVIIGGGPNRIGQGIEFDYCCCHAAFAARDLGFESVMINSNPETVSTDYDTSDLLFFEPLTLEDVLNVIERLNGASLAAAPSCAPALVAHRSSLTAASLILGAIVQFGGQTPLNLSKGLAKAGVPIIGTSVDSIDLAEDRDRFDALLTKLNLQRPAAGVARNFDEALTVANKLGYPVLVRPSFVLGGRGMEICSDAAALQHYMRTAVNASDFEHAPVLVDRFLSDATEVDVDVIADYQPNVTGEQPGRTSLIAGVMEHIEQAGIHSGDSSCVLPPYSLRPEIVARIKTIGHALARELRINGLMNVQLAIKENDIFILEVNPRAARTVPFVGKATGVPWARLAACVMMGKTLTELHAGEVTPVGFYAVKESVFPFTKFQAIDVTLGPEMRSTGEVMGIDRSLPMSMAKAQIAASNALPLSGSVFISVRNEDKLTIIPVAAQLVREGFTLSCTEGTAEALLSAGIPTLVLKKIAGSARPNVLDLMTDGQIQLVINTPTKTGWRTDEGKIRSAAVRLGIPIVTTATGAIAAAMAISALRKRDWTVEALQDYWPTPHISAGTRRSTVEPKIVTHQRAGARN